jgi:hypothetical protein
MWMTFSQDMGRLGGGGGVGEGAVSLQEGTGQRFVL